MKRTIYISFEDIEGYYHYYEEDSLGKDKTIVLKQDGCLNYMWWELDIDQNKIEKKPRSLNSEDEIASQYWIIYNIVGRHLSADKSWIDEYNINVIKEHDDSFYVYPISKLHYYIE